MPGILRSVALAKTDVSEESIAPTKVTRIGEVETTLAVTSNTAKKVTANAVFSLPTFV
jgi:hypothetical protein